MGKSDSRENTLANLEKCIGGSLVGAYTTESSLIWRFDIQTPADGIYHIYIVNQFITVAPDLAIPGMAWVMVVRSHTSKGEEVKGGTFALIDLINKIPEIDGLDMTLLSIYSDPGPAEGSYITRLTFTLIDGAFLHLSFHPCCPAMEAQLVAPRGTKLAMEINKQKGDKPIYQPGTNTVQ